MGNCISRMTECGIPETTAICIANEFIRLGQMDGLLKYILLVEEQCG